MYNNVEVAPSRALWDRDNDVDFAKFLLPSIGQRCEMSVARRRDRHRIQTSLLLGLTVTICLVLRLALLGRKLVLVNFVDGGHCDSE